jgi:thioredoxin 2
MNAEIPLEALRVVCPHCSAANRVPRNRLEEAPKCGACKRPLFDGYPLELGAAELDRHLAHGDLPVVVDFWAPWCAPCRAMAPVFEHAAQQLEPHARFVKLNTDENQAIASRLDIRGIPTLMVFRNGREVARVAGAMDAGRFRSWVQAHL